MHIDAARPDEITPALQLVFQHLHDDECSRRVANALQLVNTGAVPADGIRVAREGQEIVGAIVAMSLAGAGGLVWLPGAHSDALEDALVENACSWLASRGAKVIQALLLPTELSRAASLLAGGFSHATQLLYLQHDLMEVPSGVNDIDVKFENYTPANDAIFKQTLLQTYEQTLDCPELNGVRTIDEILEGHKAQGDFDPARWWLLWKYGKPVGVVLLTRVPETSIWDISYIGVVPQARGQGIGRAMVTRIIEDAELFRAHQLTVAVDARNTPARQLYHQLNFEHVGSREVLLRFVQRA